MCLHWQLSGLQNSVIMAIHFEVLVRGPRPAPAEVPGS